MEREGNPFFFEGSPARAVGQGERELVVVGEACCIISSSGMLNGGPSQFYAAELASDARNAIFITGYQDEESPGGRILALAEAAEPELRLMDRRVRFECKIAKYNLSAHADAGQIATLVARLGPRQCYLVHGDPAARAALAEMMAEKVEVVLPGNGEVAEFFYPSEVGRPCSTPQRPTPVQWKAETPRARPKSKTESGPLAAARRAVALISEVQLVGWRPESREVLLYVAFPALFQERRAAFLEDLSLRLSVGVVVLAKNTAGELAALGRKYLPLGSRLIKPPSLFSDGRAAFKVRFSPEVGEQAQEQYRLQIARESGLAVELVEPGDGGAAREQVGADGRMELNSAYAMVKQALGQAGLLVLRCGKKTHPDEHLEVGLLAPWLLEPHGELVSQLEEQTGYPIRAAGPNQQALEKRARELLPPAWQVLKPFQWLGRQVRLALARRPGEAELEDVRSRLQRELGLDLKI